MIELEHKSNFWQMIGWLGALGSTLLMSYYIMITGNVAHYLLLSLRNAFQGLTAADMPGVYNGLVSNSPIQLAYNFVLLSLCAFIISRGVSGGLEKFAKVALPTLFVCLCVCAAKSLTLDAAGVAVKWFLTPNISKITPTLLLDCLSQTLFLGGIGLSSLFCFGSYLHDKVDMIRSSTVIVLSNVVIALLAGFIIFPVVFTFGVDPASGSSLVFQTMPLLFANMSGGYFFGAIFFLCLFIAALSTCLGLIEGVVATVSDALNISRPKMAWMVTSVIFIISLIPILYFTPVLSDVRIFSKDVYTLLDFVTMYMVIPFGGVLIAIYACWKMGFQNLLDEANKGNKTFILTKSFFILFGVICPLMIIVVSIMGFKVTFFS